MAELINGPWMSLALVILAGIALRYAIWTLGDRSSEQHRDAEGLRERLHALSTALDQACHERGVAQANFERVVEDYESLKRGIDVREIEWKQQRETWQRELQLAAEQPIAAFSAEISSDERLRRDEAWEAKQHTWDQQRQQLQQLLSELQDQLDAANVEKQQRIEQLQEAVQRADDYAQQLHALQEAADQHAASADEQQSLFEQLQQQRTAYEEKVLLLQTEKEELARGLLREQEAARLAREQAEADGHRANQLETELGDFNALHEEYRTACREMTALREDNELAAHKLASAERSTKALQEKVLSLNVRVDQTERDLMAERNQTKSLRREHEELQVVITQLQSEKRSLQELLQIHSETLERLRADSMSIETLLERQASVQASLREHANRLQSMAVCFREESPASWAVAETDQAAILNFAAVQENPESAVALRQDAALGLVYDQAPPMKDDLKRISGIGTILEQKLHELGIYTYDQIMAWDDANVAEVSRLLGFHDRIQKEEWVAQARRLERNRRKAA